MFLLLVVICNDNSVDDMSVLVNLKGSEVKKKKMSTVSMGDGLWLTEMERVFGFLDEYDVFMDMINRCRLSYP